MMHDRVHPVNSHADDTDTVRSSKFANDDNESLHSSVSGTEESYLLKKQQPRPATPASYVIQIPKDQIYRLPPPENAHLFDTYTRRGKRGSSSRSARGCCCCCCCCCLSRRCLAWTMGVFALVLLALATAMGVLYFVSRPKLPSYTIDSISIRGFSAANLTGTNPVLSPEFDLSLRADNRRNEKIGIDYRGGSTASVAYSDVVLADGAWPTFYQGSGNVTVVGMALKGSGVRLSDESLRGLRGQVPLEIKVRVPVRVKLGSIASWAFKVKVKCDVVVDGLGSNAKVVSKSCKANAAW